MAIAAMLFAHGHASGSVLYDTFEELAATARDELSARDQIDRLRARFESSMRRMLVILAALVGYLLVASARRWRSTTPRPGRPTWWCRSGSGRWRCGGCAACPATSARGRYLDYQAVSARAAEGSR